MDKILLSNLEFYGHHGVMPEEKTLGQKFRVDAELSLDLQEAGLTDDLTKTVNYAEVYEIIKMVMERESYDLIEAVADTICRDLFEEFPTIQKIMITVKKPEAPVPGIFDYIGVQIKRERNE